jgi:hypothetical protein
MHGGEVTSEAMSSMTARSRRHLSAGGLHRPHGERVRAVWRSLKKERYEPPADTTYDLNSDFVPPPKRTRPLSPRPARM